MTTEDRLRQAQEALSPWAQEADAPEPVRLDIVLDRSHLPSAVAALMNIRWGYLVAITGLDLGAEAKQYEVLYHFGSGAALLTLRVRIAHADSVVPSITGIIPAASVAERELSEMFGIRVIGLLDQSRLFLPDDWPDGVYPLRKDAVLEK